MPGPPVGGDLRMAVTHRRSRRMRRQDACLAGKRPINQEVVVRVNNAIEIQVTISISS